MANEKFFINNAEEIVPPFNDSPYKRIIAVGDVHGKFGALQSLWKKLSVTDDDLVIFLGDYIDRGEEIAEVLKWVIEQSKKPNIKFLRGNHEQMMLFALNSSGGKDRITWLINGGKATIMALRELVGQKVFTLKEIVNFTENLPLSYSISVGDRTYFFCHAGVEEGVPLEMQEADYLLWAREEFFDYYNGNAVVISGHSPIKFFYDFDAINPRPIKLPNKNIIMTDTGAFIRGGRLSAVDILTGRYWQSGADMQGDIIFLCTGNTCRSPMAKYIMRHLLKAEKLDKKILIDSAGCSKNCGGDFMSNGACEALKDNGINFGQHISKPFTIREYKNFKHVIAMNSAIMKRAVKISHGDPDNKIRLLKDIDGNGIEVADPFGTGDYSKAYEEILRGCKVLLNEIRKDDSNG